VSVGIICLESCRSG